MTTRLYQLKADYLALRAAYDNSDHSILHWLENSSAEDFLADCEASGSLDPQLHRLYVAAKVFTIAADQGLDAAMLWKLANGGAQ